MAWISELEESKEEAREEGLAEGRGQGLAQGLEQTAISMLKDSMPISKIILYSSLPESRILELQKNLTKKHARQLTSMNVESKNISIFELHFLRKTRP